MRKLTLDQIKKKAVPVLQSAGIKRSSLFGSYVRGDQRNDSDIDILVEFPKGTSLFDVVDLQDKLEEVLGKKVDLGEYDTIKQRIKNNILKEAIQIL